MRTRGLAIALFSTALIAQGCAQGEKKKDDKSGSSENQGSDDSKSASGADPSKSDTSNMTADDFPEGFYTGFDGASKFSLLLPGFRNYTVGDASIAKIETLTVQVSDKTINDLIAERQKTDPKANADQIKKMFGRQRTVYKLTPLKAGKTTLTAVSKAGGKGGPGGGGHKGPSADSWSKPDNKAVVLLVANYPAGLVAKGKDRYTRDGDGNKRPCASCHETGESGAPPHELGNVMEIPDVALKQWIETGKLGDRVAKIQHTWQFDNDDDEQGVMAYLRTKQTDDVETLIKLEFEEVMANMPAGGPGGPGGAGGATGG